MSNPVAMMARNTGALARYGLQLSRWLSFPAIETECQAPQKSYNGSSDNAECAELKSERSHREDNCGNRYRHQIGTVLVSINSFANT